MVNNQGDPLYTLKCGCCSFFASYIVGIFHPLQLLKTRLQSHDGKLYDNIVPKYENIINGLKTIYKQQGLYGLYKGIHLTMLTQAGSSALFFSIYEKRKLHYQQTGTSTVSAATYAGMQASIISTLITQPVWVIKTRVLLNTQKNLGQINNTIRKTQQIWKQGGFKGFYSGLSMNLILCFTGALQMHLYEYFGIQTTNWGSKNFICGGFSKIFTTVITYPFTTVRTRIQQDQYFHQRAQAKYKGVGDIVKKIITQQGITGFYKGLSPNLLRGIPQRGVYFYFYQLFKELVITTPNKN